MLSATHAEAMFCVSFVDNVPSIHCMPSEFISVIGGLQARQSPPSEHIPAFLSEVPELAISLLVSSRSAMRMQPLHFLLE